MDRQALEERLGERFTLLFQAAGVTDTGELDGSPAFTAVLDDTLADVPLGTDDLVQAASRRLTLAVLNYYAYDAVLAGLGTRVSRSADSPQMQASLSDMYKAAQQERDKARLLADSLGWTPEADLVTADSLDLAPDDWEYDAAARQGSSSGSGHTHYPISDEFAR